MYDYDLIIIGSGPAGEKAAIQAAILGAKVLIIEKGDWPGGASVLTGTIPSKAIRETACYINHLKKNHLHGFEVKVTQQLSALEVLHRHNLISNRRAKGILINFKKYNIAYIQAKASFIDRHQLALTYPNQDSKSSPSIKKVSAPKIIIAVGSKPFHPDDVGFDHKFIVDSDSILKISEIPKSLIIYGGGVIGCEYASIFSYLGTKIFLVSPQADLLSFLDKEISSCIKSIYEKSGITIYLDAQYEKISQKNDQVSLKLKSGEIISANMLLYANGRQGNTKGLCLDNCGLNVNQKSQLDVNKCFQTSINNIYAVGDIIGFPALASTANGQGRSAAQHAIKGHFEFSDLKNIPIGIYTIPEVSMVGLSEEALNEKKIPYEKGICHFKDLARAELLGEEEGLLKLLFSPKSKKLLGVHIIGYYASDLIHIGQAIIYYGGTIDYFLKEVINFPTLSSAYKVAAWDAIGRLNETFNEQL
ncbi:MAG: Si-specific NAD(P)(+) transhydrogenase [SAR324 cluster bacterium]|nr:Si-specific NAD(P)(+) transhydrogenase [SAR324 cluster bacterium]